MQTIRNLIAPGTTRRGPIGVPAPPLSMPHSERIIFLDHSISIWAWPSRGGLIVLENAGPLDFDHLGLDRFELQMHRSANQDEEDTLCQKLLQLGARWSDSEERYNIVANADETGHPASLALRSGEHPPPSDMERRWVSVGIEDAGFWVLEYDRAIFFVGESDNLVADDVARITLAKTMAEKCTMLKRMGATFYAASDRYDGLACFNAWDERVSGEFAQ